MMVSKLTIESLTLPSGRCLYVLSGVAKVPDETVARNTAIFLSSQLLRNHGIGHPIPGLTLTLPRALYG